MRLWAVMALMSGALLAINHLGVDRVFVESVGKLQPQRVTPFMRLALAAGAAWAWLSVLRDRPVRVRLIVMAVLAPVFVTPVMAPALLAALWAMKGARSHGVVLLLAALASAAACALAFGLYGSTWLSGLAAHWSLWALVFVVLALASWRRVALACSRRARACSGRLALAGLSVAVASSLLFMSPPPPSPRGPAERLALLVAERTEPGDLVLIPPLGPEFERFALLSQRPVVLSWKNVPYDRAALQEWLRRLNVLLGPDARPRREKDRSERWASHDGETLLALACSFSAAVLVSRSDWHGGEAESLGRRLAEDGPWVAWSIDPALCSRVLGVAAPTR